MQSPSKKPLKLQILKRETLIKGQPAELDCVEIDGQVYDLMRGPLTTIGLCFEDEWYQDVKDPHAVIGALSADPDVAADIFTFWQRLPDVKPKYDFFMEWESIAALPVKTFEYWWNKQAKGTTRNMVRKSQRAGLELRETSFDDEFVRGMTDIFNESPVRQGKPFWHYGKDANTVKRQFSHRLFRENMIGAYYEGELIGFVMLGNAGNYGVIGQIISKIKHRDKAPNNALIAKAVEVCEKRGFAYLVYTDWNNSSLVDFKRHSGFEEIKLPRYFAPLTRKGTLALKLGVHRGWREAVPKQIRDPLKRLRKFWTSRRA
jgi:hypothetical protein